MKVLFIFDRVAHYHIDLFQCLEKELKKANHELYLLSGKTNANEKGRVGLDRNVIENELKYEYKEVNILSYKLRYQKEIFKTIKKIKPDIIIVPGHVGSISFWQLGFCKRHYGFKLFSWECGYEYHENLLKKILTKLFLYLFDYHFAYHTNANKYLTDHGIKSDIVTIIYNTINENNIKCIDKKNAKEYLRKKHPNTNDKFIILFVGAILKEKKIDLLIKAFQLLNNSNTALIIVGDGYYLQELNSKYKSENIIFTGKIIEEVGVYFDAADVFVLPGTGGLAINEAMAHSLPIISGYADGSADDLVINEVNGYRLYQYTENELVAYLNKLINDHSLTHNMGMKSKELITSKFSFNNYLKRIVNSIYQ
jgi:glycosyltransferase involved in cell wall biosynthesis